MKSRKLFLPVFFLAVLAAIVFSSCERRPFACFSINVNTDSIHVNQKDTFDGSCSLFAKEYFWQFETKKDTLIYYDKAVGLSFTDTGDVTIELDVLNGSKDEYTIETIHVKP